MLLEDYKKQIKQVFLDKVNKASNVTLTLEDVNLSDPFPVSGSHNSAFWIEGNPNSKFKIEGRKEIRFNRHDLAVHFKQFSQVELLAQQEKTIHDLLPEINKQTGLLLTEHDIVNKPLPSVLPRKPLAARYVTLEATPYSATFIGKVEIRLGPNLDKLIKTDHVLIIKYNKDVEPKEQVKVYTRSGEPWKLFNFLGNIVSITRFTVDKFRAAANGFIHLYGAFTLATVTEVGEFILNGSHLIVDVTGMAISCDDISLPETVNSFTNNAIQYTYYTEGDQKSLKRYDVNGIIDTRFSPQFAFTIRKVIITDNHNLFVVSEPFESRDVNGSGALYNYSKIFKLKPSGTVDTSFKAITVRNESGVTPFIEDLTVDENGNIYVYIEPPGGYSINVYRPVINGNALELPTWSDTTVTPVLRFDPYGTLDRTWVTNFNFLAPVIFNNVSDSVIIPKNKLLLSDKYIILLQRKINGITGKVTVITTLFDKTNGSYVLPKSDNLLETPNWNELLTVANYAPNYFLFIGTVQGVDNELLLVDYFVDKLKQVKSIPYIVNDTLCILPFNFDESMLT